MNSDDFDNDKFIFDKCIVIDNELIVENTSHFICNNCHTVPLIEFQSFITVSYQCLCFEHSKLNIKDLLEMKIFHEFGNYNKIKDNKSRESGSRSRSRSRSNKSESFLINKKRDYPLNLKCIEHDENFDYYCLVCKKNLCRECLRISNDHENHSIEIFDFKFSEINKIISYNKDFLKIKENDSDHIKKFKELMKIIINDFKYSPNYSHFFIIKSFDKFLNEKNKGQLCDDSNINRKLIYIKKRSELEDNFNNAQNIKKISINNSNQNVIFLINIIALDLINLVELDLSENHITNIEPLAKNKLGNLEILNLSYNEIDDNNIKLFFQFDFPKLRDLNLYWNRLTSPKFLNLKNDSKNLPNLKKLILDNNLFKFNKNNLNDKYNFSSLIEIGISKNFFNQESIKYIQCFKFTNLEKIYLNHNNLERFDFVNNLDLPSIKEFYLNNNNLTIFEPLKKYKTLEVIEMKDNNITDIECIEEFISNFKNLKKFNLQSNDIHLDLVSYFELGIIKKQYNITLIINSK